MAQKSAFSHLSGFHGHLLISLEDQLRESDGLLLLEVERGVSMRRQTTRQAVEALCLRPLLQSIAVINTMQITQEDKLESLVLWLVFLDLTESKAYCQVCSTVCSVSLVVTQLTNETSNRQRMLLLNVLSCLTLFFPFSKKNKKKLFFFLGVTVVE